MSWSTNVETAYGSTEVELFPLPGTDTVFVAYTDGSSAGSPNVKIQKSTDGGNTWGAAVTIAATVVGGDLQLNNALAYDPSAGSGNGRLFVLWTDHNQSASAAAGLNVSFSDDLGATWSAGVQLDSGAARGNNWFYRVGIAACNGRARVLYSAISGSTFTTDGKLWSATFDGSSWTTLIDVTPAGAAMPTEPNVAIDIPSLTVVWSWYDPGVVSNVEGDLWVMRSLDGGQTLQPAVKVTNTTDYGRPRPALENGTCLLVANQPWNKESSSLFSGVTLLKSTDNAVTFGTPRQVLPPGTSWSRDHPDVCLQGSFVGVICRATASGSTGHAFIYSTDGGASFSAESNPFGDSTTSDAPRLRITKNYLIATGYDQAAAKAMQTNNPQWFTVMPQAQTGVLDAGVGANQGPPPSSGWGGGFQDFGANDGLVRASNAITRNPSGADPNQDNYWATPFGANHEIWVTIVGPPGNGGVGNSLIELIVGMVTPGSATTLNSLRSYFAEVVWQVGPAWHWHIFRNDGASPVSLGSNFNTTETLIAGDIFACQRIGSYIAIWKYDSTTAVWKEMHRGVDSTYFGRFIGAMSGVGSGTTAPSFAPVGGGALSAPVNVTLPLVSGNVSAGQQLTVSNGSWSNQPVRWTYQWQYWDGTTWQSVPQATLPFFTVPNAMSQYRCQVTAYNAVGSTTANSVPAVSQAFM